MNTKTNDTEQGSFAGGAALEAVLDDRLSQAKALGIYMEVEPRLGALPAGYPAAEGDVARMAACLLDNAIAVCRGLDPGNRWIYFELDWDKNALTLECRYAARGLGTTLKEIEEAAMAYGGEVSGNMQADGFGTCIRIRFGR